MKKIAVCFSVLLYILTIQGCQDSTKSQSVEIQNPFYSSSKPCTRWWWFATEIKKPDIKYQLDWAKANNFGGVEVAWVYPLYRYKNMYKFDHKRHYAVDSSAQKWLSPEWSEVVTYTKAYADSIGLDCDFTFGSAWPVAGSNINKEHSTQIYGDTSFRQYLTFGWTWPENQLVINHLDSNAFNLFAEPVASALNGALQGSKSALFTDSWEIKLNHTNKIWTPGFGQSFEKKFQYDIIPYMEMGLDSFPDVRYDYMLHLEDYVAEGFYKPYVRKCKELGAWSRVQCLAAPGDIMTLYSLVDIPETEGMLNNPNFSRIVSSSACLASKKIVSSETFTDMYGFPSTYLRQEQTADLKMVADALFAQGANHHFYHGMPYNPKGSDTIEFFATIFIGRGASLTEELPVFNSYMEKVAGIMQKGKTYSDVAVYLPYEDGVMKGAYPEEKRRVWVWGEYEMRFIKPALETEGYHPLWINRHFLNDAKYKDDKLVAGDAEFSSIYVDVKFMDERALRRLVELAKQGLPVCLKQDPKQPGKEKVKDYNSLLTQLKSLENVSSEFKEVIEHKPMISGDSIPAYWCRKEKDGTLYIFLAQKLAKDLEYPIYSGQSFSKVSEFRDLTLHVNGKTISEKFEFKPYQSIMLKISPNGKMTYEDISFIPKDPVIKPREPQRMNF